MDDELERVLLEKRIVNPAKIAEAQSIRQQTRLGMLDILVSEKWLKNKDIKSVLKQLTGRNIDILQEEVIVDEELYNLVPKEFCRERNVAPLRLENGTLHVAVNDILNRALVEEIQFLTEHSLQLYYETENKIQGMLSGSTLSDNIQAEAHAQGEGRIVQLVQSLIIGALQKRASDIHIEPGNESVKVRYRIDGVLVQMKAFNILKEEHAALLSRIKILSGMDISERRLPQDGRILFKFQHKKQGLKEVDIRVSVIPSMQGEAAVLRILDRDALLINLNALGFSRTELKLIKTTLHRSHGMVLMSGPTGSGKTTSLYAMLAHINTSDKKIVTIEDPVEYQIDGIEQIQAHADIGLSFAHGLRSFLRHDPDVIMVGEIRDEETAEIAIRSSLTGHLVLSTIHTNDAPSSVTRLLDMGIKPYLVASTLALVISQRLVRTLCTHCKQGTNLTKEQAREFGIQGLLKVRSRVYQPVGCSKCENTGYLGRQALYEIMPISARIKQAILDEKSALEIKQIAQREKMKTLVRAGIEKVKKGETTLEEVFRVAQEV